MTLHYVAANVEWGSTILPEPLSHWNDGEAVSFDAVQMLSDHNLAKHNNCVVLWGLNLRPARYRTWRTEKPTKLHFTTYLTHLELEETPLLLHLLCDFSAGDLRADHPVLLGVLSLLLLDLCTDTEDKTINGWMHFSSGPCLVLHQVCVLQCVLQHSWRVQTI